MSLHIPLSQPDITQLEIDAVVDVLRTPRLSLGPKMQQFEEEFAAYIGLPHGIAVSSGTAGLHLILLALGIGAGDEVILPSFTFVAAANAIRYVGAIPVFADIDAVTLNLNPAVVQNAITPRTRAILVVHTFGVPAAMDALLSVAHHHNLAVIEDACEAIGAEYQGQRVGSFGDAAVFSFYPNKQITTGEGGLIVTASAQFANEMKALRNQGRRTRDDWFQHSLLGYNYRLSELNSALGIAQLSRIQPILAARAHVAACYHRALADIPHLERPPLALLRSTISWFVYVVRLGESISEVDRDAIAIDLSSQGIECGRYFPPLHRLPLYQDFTRVPGDLPQTTRIAGRTLALPFFNALTETQIQQVSRHLRTAMATLRPQRS